MPIFRHAIATIGCSWHPGLHHEEVLDEKSPNPGVMNRTKAQDIAIHAVSPLFRPSMLPKAFYQASTSTLEVAARRPSAKV